jgi:hypothetical protein
MEQNCDAVELLWIHELISGDEGGKPTTVCFHQHIAPAQGTKLIMHSLHLYHAPNTEYMPACQPNWFIGYTEAHRA